MNIIGNPESETKVQEQEKKVDTPTHILHVGEDSIVFGFDPDYPLQKGEDPRRNRMRVTPGDHPCLAVSKIMSPLGREIVGLKVLDMQPNLVVNSAVVKGIDGCTINKVTGPPVPSLAPPLAPPMKT